MKKELREKRRELLREYEETIIGASSTRREKIDQAEAEFDAMRKQAHQKYHEAFNKLEK